MEFLIARGTGEAAVPGALIVERREKDVQIVSRVRGEEGRLCAGVDYVAD